MQLDVLALLDVVCLAHVVDFHSMAGGRLLSRGRISSDLLERATEHFCAEKVSTRWHSRTLGRSAVIAANGSTPS